MKMEMWLCAESAGAVKSVHAKVGDQVESGALLVELELESTQKEA
jgi:geranyl-CoA carboxylase alpha subunit